MPVTARLSKKFYDAWGEELAQDLVDWFNQVDATYKADLKELNELNFVRFDAKLEQRIAELRSQLKAEIAEFRTELKAEIAEFRTELKAEIAEFRTEVKAEIAELRAELKADIGGVQVESRAGIQGLEQRIEGRLDSSLAALKADLIKWMFLFWAGTALTVIGLATALLK